jgi:hypothetical protein
VTARYRIRLTTQSATPFAGLAHGCPLAKDWSTAKTVARLSLPAGAKHYRACAHALLARASVIKPSSTRRSTVVAARIVNCGDDREADIVGVWKPASSGTP